MYLVRCWQSFLPAYTDQWSPQPLTPQRAEEEGKGFVYHTTTKVEAWGNNIPLKGPGTGLAVFKMLLQQKKSMIPLKLFNYFLNYMSHGIDFNMKIIL